MIKTLFQLKNECESFGLNFDITEKEKGSTSNIKSAKLDIAPFIPNLDKIAIWSNDFFTTITNNYSYI